MSSTKYSISEILNELGENREDYFQAVAPPIIQSSNFHFKTLDSFREKIVNEWTSNIYTRGNNPTVHILRKKIAALEGAEDSIITSSGSAAIAMAVISQVKAGDHVICIQNPYSWTYKLLTNLLARFGVESTFIDGTNNANFIKATKDNTKLIYLESPNSLTFEVQDLRFVANFARENNIITAIDNTHCTPIYQNPLSFGIDIVIHSASKYLNGHSDILGGVICANNHIIRQIAKQEYMILGSIISPNDAFLMIRGLRTLALRVERSDSSCRYIVDHLAQNPKIKKIYYTQDPNHPQASLIKSQMKGNGGLFSLELNTDSMQEVEDFVHSLRHFLFAVSWGGHESLIFPTCAFYGVQGIKPYLPFQFIRFYIGLEDRDLLLQDIIQALDKIN
ncbi:MAG: PLP-dependent transferase [Saprospiraceae bacterium]|nr:PLP-dependent transferase [Saprospiraceae bacterium]